jgi:hypothetical protein
MDKQSLILESLQNLKESGDIKRTFKNKQELVDFVKTQLNVELKNDPNELLNHKRNILYTEIPKDRETPIFSLLTKYGIRYEQHMKGYYWIYIR